MLVSILGLFCVFSWFCPPESLPAEFQRDRFFLAGDGRLHIKNLKTGSETDRRMVTSTGAFDEEGLAAIDGVFEFPGRAGGEHISLRLLFMLDYFSDLVAPGKVINLTSGYRSPEYNSKLRNAGGNVAATSLHMDGMALDFYIEGVNGKELWRIIKKKECCGVGHYGGSAVHLDSGKPRFWEAATSKVRTTESERNRRIFLSTDFDRYEAGETLRLFFASVSDFGFGVGRQAYLVSDPEGHNVVGALRLKSEGDTECISVPDRGASRSLMLTLPEKLGKGRYRVRLDFCRRPFEEMPQKVVSTEIELRSPRPRQ
jgi:uncharacterized protein YcbK (DUF882 family)